MGATLVGDLVGHVVGGDQHVAALVHALEDLVELVHGGHVEVVALLAVVAVEAAGLVNNQGVEEDVGDLVHLGIGHQLRISLSILGDLGIQLLGGTIAGIALEQGNSGFVIIARRQKIRLFDQFLDILGDLLLRGLGIVLNGVRLLGGIIISDRVPDQTNNALDAGDEDHHQQQADQTETDGGPIFAQDTLPLGTALAFPPHRGLLACILDFLFHRNSSRQLA